MKNNYNEPILVPNEKKLDVLLTEYEKVQDSAEHHDTLIWNTSNIFLVATGGLLLFLLDNSKNIDRVFKIILTLFGVLLCLLSIYFCCSFRKIKNSKYKRAKEIEKTILDNFGKQIMWNCNIESKKLKQTGVYYLLWLFLTFIFGFNLWFLLNNNYLFLLSIKFIIMLFAITFILSNFFELKVNSIG